MTGFEGAILARDQDGDEHLIQVTEDAVGAGLITISDDGMTRIMSVMVALELSYAIIQVATRLRQAEGAGPFSSTF